MLTLFLLHIVISGSCLFAGFLLYRYVLRTKGEEGKPLVFYFVSGLISLALIAQILSLFLPINATVQSVLLVVFLLTLYLHRVSFGNFLRQLFSSWRRQHFLFFPVLFMGWLLILLLNAGPVQMDDTGSYHIQSVKWIEEYGTVPGLVHLHERFAFNSSWFHLVALFQPPAAGLNYYTALNGIISVWMLGYLLNFVTGQKHVPVAGALLLIFSIICWPLIRGNATNTNYDYITAFVLFVLFVETALLPFDKNEYAWAQEWLIWPVFLVTVRIINFPILLLSIFSAIYLLRRGRSKNLIIGIVIGGLLVIPFLARNIMLSGYPFYPSLAFGFPVDWKADTEATIRLLDYIKYYNRVSTGVLPLETTAAMTIFEWPAAWLRHMFSYDKLIFFAGLAGLIGSPLYFKIAKKDSGSRTGIFVLVLILQVVSWFFIAPDPRFIYGCLLAGLAILALCLSRMVPPIWFSNIKKLSLFLVTTVCGFFMIFKFTSLNEPVPPLYPASIPAPRLNRVMKDNIPLYIPDKLPEHWNARCYDSPLPCLYEINPRLQARGNSVKRGFRLKKQYH
jgi:hypothetical protein